MINLVNEDILYEINNYLNNTDSKNFENVLKNNNINFKFDYPEITTTTESSEIIFIHINDDNSHSYYIYNDNLLTLLFNFVSLKLIFISDIPNTKIIETIKIRNEIQKIIIKNLNNIKLIEFNFNNYPLLSKEYITYYDDGNISSIYKYKNNGKLNGKSYIYYENKNINSIENYKDGLLYDEQYIYYEDGQTLSSKQIFNLGIKDKTWYQYYENKDTNGNLIVKSITNYSNDKKHGIYICYHKNKNIYKKEKYNNGQLIYSLFIPFDDNIINKIDIDIE